MPDQQTFELILACVFLTVIAVVAVLVFTTEGPRHAHPNSEVNHGRSGGGWGLLTCSEPGCEWTEIF